MKGKRLTIFTIALLVIGIASAAMAEPVVIRMMQEYRVTEAEWQKALVDEFNATHTDIQIELIGTPDAMPHVKAISMLVAGEAPHLVISDPDDTTSWGLQGLTIDLEPFYQKEKNQAPFKDFFPATLDMHRINGGLYGIPMDLQVEAFFYAEDAFAEAGLSYPNASWTWDTFTKEAPKLVKDSNSDGTPERFAIIYPQWMHWWPIIWHYGGQFVDSKVPTKFTGDSPQVKEALTLVNRWINEMRVMSPRRFLPGTTGPNLVSTRTIATAIGSSLYMQDTVKLESDTPWNVTNLPKGPTGNAALTNARGWVVFKDAGNAEEAWEVLKFFSSQKAMEMAVQLSGYIVPHRQVAVGSWVAKYSKPSNRMVFIEALETARPLPYIEHSVIDKVVREYWLNNQTLPQAMEKLKIDVETWLAENKR